MIGGTGPGEITEALARLRDGDTSARSRLAPLVYAELRRIAARHMLREAQGHILQPSALVNEAFIRLVDREKAFENRGHFYSLASSLMRRILVDYARAGQAAKRGPGIMHVDLSEAEHTVAAGMRSYEMLALDEALSRLSKVDERQARIVEMRYFGGMSIEEIAEALVLSPRTVKRDWRSARAWLHAELLK
jgi:RNA polymerase sigma factor (TIGR02999 family)